MSENLSNYKKTIIIEGPNITEEDKNILINKLGILEKQLNKYILNPNSINNNIYNEIENNLYECQKRFNTIEIELKPYSQNIKVKYKYPYLKSKMKQMKGNFKELETIINNKSNNIENEEYQKLISHHNETNEGLKNIKRSIKSLSSSIDSDKDTLQSLKRQGDIITNANIILNNTKVYIKKTSYLLNKMICFSITNKFILILIIFILAFINLILLYRKIFKK